jgi:hypothetical protein
VKKLVLFVAVAALLAAGAGQALARPSAAHAKTVNVVMHDPGCHWFAVGSSFQKSLRVAGPVKLANYDEATLVVKGPQGTIYARIGHPVTLAKGAYAITMVHQAPDDNHLKLVVK